ncbi:PHP domain-containing protein [Nocardioides sp. AX2bis]|uniref:PHP domain-containing protein n=1 Tax=Nocardioides sp. AX2bis TaxID=2653157 RepID=UPI0012F3CB47|nr:PHP domain-containing protein [Nocardioides sp. AX2bis]VXB13262.1 Phosphatase [Nocardioides sp. AX2bis]
MRIDLHTHSDVSDGTAPPASVVRDAAAAGLDVVALTDHDTTQGWAEAEQAAREVGIDLVRGLEISCTHQGRGLHLLAYLPDPTHPGLRDLLGRIVEGRSGRVPAMLAQLREAGVAIEQADLDREGSRTAATGRPHVADALVRLGVVASRDEAFRDWLDAGRPGFVDRWAASVTEMVQVVGEAGGVTVVAHPWGRGGRSALPEEEIAVLAAAGLAGIEVDHQDHTEADRARLREVAADLDLVVTGSSDHHGTGKVDHDLGCHTTDPEEYERLLARASAASAASGRDTPEVVQPR